MGLAVRVFVADFRNCPPAALLGPACPKRRWWRLRATLRVSIPAGVGAGDLRRRPWSGFDRLMQAVSLNG
jgi:hypothetical protein